MMAKLLKFFRRPFLKATAGLGAWAVGGEGASAGDAGGGQTLLARTEMAVQVVDFGWRREAFMFDTAGPAGALTNEIYTLETGAHHVRFRFQNGLTESWTIAGASYAPTALAQTNPVDEAGQAVPLRPVTFGNGGRDIALADQQSAAAPSSLTLPAAANGATIQNAGYEFRTIPTIVFSDWMPITTVARADRFLGALVSLRVWTTSVEFTGIRPKRVNGGGFFQGTAARPWRTFAIPLYDDAGDRLTAAMDDPPAGIFGNALCCGIQSVGHVPGLTLLSVGDSALMGGGEAQGYLGPIKRAADMMSTPELPVSHISAAIFGCPSSQFIAAGRLALQTNKVSCAFIQTLSGNDPHTVDSARQSLALAVALADECRSNGTVGVLLSPGPPRPDEKPWKAAQRGFTMNALGDLQARGYHVLDVVPLLSGGSSDGYVTIQESLVAGDNVHLNSSGDIAFAKGVVSYLRALPSSHH